MQRRCELTHTRWESMQRRKRKRVAVRLLEIVITVAVVAWAVAAHAQNPFFDSPEEYWGSYDYQEQQERTQGYYDRQDEALQDALDRWGNVEDSPEYRSWERQRGLDACLGITNNPALQSRCLQGLQ